MDYAKLFQAPQKPVTKRALSALLKSVGPLPSAYVSFLGATNGAEGGIDDIGADCLNLWAAEEIAKLNADYEIARWCPTLLAIGSNGGSDAFGFDRRPLDDPESWPVVRVGFGDLDPATFVVVAPSFTAWASRNFRGRAGG
jgi:hypothetical protein